MKLHGTFDRAQYLPGQPIRLTLPEGMGSVRMRLFRLEREIPCPVSREGRTLILPPMDPGCYGICLEAGQQRWEGAFDVAETPGQVIRYGFLSDFGSGDDDLQAVAWLRDLHCNTVQFYDWMYRHDRLLPPENRYQDPLGREMDLSVIQRKIQSCKQAGIRPMAYGAIYAATKELFQAHPDWGMYTMEGQVMTFADWLVYMNIAPACPWRAHLLEEYRKAVAFGFSGIHMDTYGFPKQVWDADHRPVDLEREIPGLIDQAAEAVRQADPAAGVIFNAVNNWPMEAVAKTGQDAVYIEVWPPNDCYWDLYQLIRQARACSGKPPVLAAYLKPFLEGDTAGAERAFRLCWAAISAAGGTQLVLGENRAVLRDSYYANYAALREDFLPVVQKYCDFSVGYGELTYWDAGTDVSRTAAGGINEEIHFSAGACEFSTDGRENTVWSVIRQSADRLTIHLINLRGNDSLWNQQKGEPETVRGIHVDIRLDRPVSGIYAASPDGDSLTPKKLPVTYRDTPQGRIYATELPELAYWAVLWVRQEE